MDMAKPKIRFKGYTDEWEQRKLDNWGSFYYGRSCPKWSVTEDATIPCIRYGELYTKFGAKIDKVYSYTNMSPENLRFSKGTEVLIPRVGEDPMDYNHCTWLSMPNVAIGEMISVFNTDNNPLFTATMFNATLQNEFAMRVEGGSVTNLYFEKLKNIEVLFPSIAEQERIAAYFERFDNLITLHQRKCEQAKKLKKYMLQKMFPQNGQKVPEIRFKGFTDDWEQRKLNEVTVKIGSGKTPSGGKSAYVDTGIPLIRSQNVNDDKVDFNDIVYIDELTDESMANSRVFTNDVLLNITGASIGRSAVYKGLDQANVNQHVCIVRPTDGYCPDFVQLNLASDSGQKQIESSQAGGGREGLNFQQIGKMHFSFPTLDEQKQIGGYFNALDNLITLHQQKCDELKNIKKFMLQNMFI